MLDQHEELPLGQAVEVPDGVHLEDQQRRHDQDRALRNELEHLGSVFLAVVEGDWGRLQAPGGNTL